MEYKNLTVIVFCLIISNIYTNEIITKDELDINIDVKNLVAEFDERVNFSLKLKSNDLNVQKIEKILPDLNDVQFFDLKVTSEKANIIKFNVININDPKNPKKKKKILNIEYKLKEKQEIDFNNNIKIEGRDKDKDNDNEFTTLIDFCICFKTKDFAVVKNKIFLRDVPFNNLENKDETLNVKVDLYNIPENSKVQKLEIDNQNSQNYNKDKSNDNNNNESKNLKKRINLENEYTKYSFKENLKDNSLIKKNIKNQIKNKKSDRISLNFKETFLKDSVTFLSINMVLKNKTDLINQVKPIEFNKKIKNSKFNLMKNSTKVHNYSQNDILFEESIDTVEDKNSITGKLDFFLLIF
jgi:hypothetical protein